jgi:hypothetical protein
MNCQVLTGYRSTTEGCTLIQFPLMTQMQRYRPDSATAAPEKSQRFVEIFSAQWESNVVTRFIGNFDYAQ